MWFIQEQHGRRQQLQQHDRVEDHRQGQRGRPRGQRQGGPGGCGQREPEHERHRDERRSEPEPRGHQEAAPGAKIGKFKLSTLGFDH